jgi:hypothetical protein
MLEEDALSGMHQKQLEWDHSLLISVAQTYQDMVTYLKGIHLTLDGWRGGRDEQSWKQSQSWMEYLRRNGDPKGLLV